MTTQVGISSVHFFLSNVAFVVFLFSVFSDNPFFSGALDISDSCHGSVVTGLAYGELAAA